MAGGGDDRAFDGADVQIGDACGEQVVDDGQTLLFVDGGGSDEFDTCLQALRIAATEKGVPASDLDAMLDRGDGGSTTAGDLRVSLQRVQVPDKDTSFWFVEFADCRRTLAPLNRRAWSAGVPWDRFLYSPCDEDLELEAVSVTGGGARAPSD